MKVNADNLDKAVIEAMSEYKGLVGLELKDAVKETSQKTKRQLKSISPKNKGDYAKGWALKTIRQTSNSIEITVYNKTNYQLTHLLEKGHAKVNGGRTKAIPHISTAEQDAIKELEESIKRRLSK